MRKIYKVYLSLYFSRNGLILMYAGAQYKILAVLAFSKKRIQAILILFEFFGV